MGHGGRGRQGGEGSEGGQWGKNLIWKKKYNLLMKNLVSEEVLDSVSFRFWVCWVTLRLRHFLVSKLLHFLDGFGFGIERI